jgi:protein-S-isoprenylcysteine O-methyltransferase Ste14
MEKANAEFRMRGIGLDWILNFTNVCGLAQKKMMMSGDGQSRGSRGRNPLQVLLRVPVPWVFVLAYFVGVGLEMICPTRIPGGRARLSLTIGGILLLVAGALLAAWCLRIFWKARTTTVPGEASATLVTWGPYRLSRNPMYVALSVAYLGEAGILRQGWPLVFLPLTIAYVNRMVIPLEERKLREVFGAKYEEYKARVRRWV